MTTQKQFKSRIRARMAATGERYAAARAQLVEGSAGDQDHSGSVVDAGWALRGGSDPDAAALANLLANAGVAGPIDVRARNGRRGQRPVVQVDPSVPFG